MSTSNQGAIRQTSTPKIQHIAVQIVVVMPPVVSYFQYKARRHLSKVSPQKRLMLLAILEQLERELVESQTDTQ